MESNFNVSNPTKENIEYAFKNLLYYLTAAIYLEIYINEREKLENIYVQIKEIVDKYVNSGSLLEIDYRNLEDIKFELIDIDTETKMLKSYYVEWTLLWFESLISLRNSEIIMRGEK